MEKYKSREYCKAIKCDVQEDINEMPWKKQLYKVYCERCSAYKFHHWLQENGYEIVKRKQKYVIGKCDKCSIPIFRGENVCPHCGTGFSQ